MNEHDEPTGAVQLASKPSREHEPGTEIPELELDDDELPFAPPQLHKTAIRLRPIVEALSPRPAVASGSAKLRDLAASAHGKIRAGRTRLEGVSALERDRAAAAAPSSVAGPVQKRPLVERFSQRLAREISLGRYELRETWNDVARLGRRWRRRRHGVRVGQEALARYRDLGDHRREALELNALARIYRERGQLQEATVCYTQALAIFERLGNRRGECLSLSNLGLAHDAQGHRHKAVRCYEEALDIARMLGDRHIEGQVLANLGTAYRRQGRRREARELWRESLALLTPGSSAHRQLSQHLG